MVNSSHCWQARWKQGVIKDIQSTTLLYGAWIPTETHLSLQQIYESLSFSAVVTVFILRPVDIKACDYT